MRSDCFLGVGLEQRRDYTALAVVERAALFRVLAVLRSGEQKSTGTFEFLLHEYIGMVLLAADTGPPLDHDLGELVDRFGLISLGEVPGQLLPEPHDLLPGQWDRTLFLCLLSRLPGSSPPRRLGGASTVRF